jgi:hypothetical protein
LSKTKFTPELRASASNTRSPEKRPELAGFQVTRCEVPVATLAPTLAAVSSLMPAMM